MTDEKRPRGRVIDYNSPDWPAQAQQIERQKKAAKRAALYRYRTKRKGPPEPIRYSHEIAFIPYQRPKPHPFRTYSKSMTMNKIAELHASQGGKCAICCIPINVYGVTRAVDHDHDTGAVRGMLCKACNVGLGNFRDDPRRMVNALVYLKQLDRKFFTAIEHKVTYLHPDEKAIVAYDDRTQIGKTEAQIRASLKLTKK